MFRDESEIFCHQSRASRRDREFLPFSLMLRDEIENFCLSVSCFETRMRIFSYNLMFRDESEIFCHQSRASRRDREFLPFSLMLRDKIENFCLSVSFFETRMRISVFTLVLRDENENNVEKNVLLLGDGFPYFYVWGGVGWKWKWLLEGWSKFWFRLLRFPAKPFKPVYIYRHIKVFKHPPHNQNLNLFQIICILNRKKTEEIFELFWGNLF